MRSKSARKVSDEDEPRSSKIRSSSGKRRRARRSPSHSASPSPARKRSKKLLTTKKTKSTKSKGGSSSSSRRRHRSLSPSPSLSTGPSSPSRSSSRSSSSASERSVSPPPRSRSRDIRKKKERGRDRKRTTKTSRRRRRSRSSSASTETRDSSRSRSRSKSKSRKRRGGARDDDDYHASRAHNKNSIEDSDRDHEAIAVAKKRKNDIDDHEKNVVEISPSKNANETEDILPAGSASPEAEDLELILRQKALDNFRKFRGAAVMAGKTHNNGIGKDAVTDSPQSTDTEIAEASSMGDHSQRHRSGLGTNHSAGSARSTSPSWKQESCAGMSRGAGSSGIFESGSTSGLIEQKRSSLEVTRSDSQIRLQDGRTSSSVTQRLGTIPGSSSSVKQRLGSNAGVSSFNGTPRVRSVVSIPGKEGLDASTFITPPSACDNFDPVESISEVRHPAIETTKVEGTNEDDRKASEASAPSDSILSASEGKGQPGIDDKEGSEFEKKTFSRVHEGEAVQVSYKVYIPKKNPALARRKLQR